jgi:dTDP-4-amino-4,6-dideoxygalactose transaminase
MGTLAINGGKKVRTAPWSTWPIWDEREIKALEATVRSGHWGRIYEGSQVEKFEKAFAAYQDAKFGVCVTNGTAALVVALQAAGIDFGDEVLVPSYTFVATATAVLECNAVPIFVDIDLDTHNMDVNAIEAAITPRTRAIMPVHFAGRACDMDRILAIARRHKLAVVEDACHSWGAMWKDRKLGAVGDIGGVSFQASKHLTAGEGGIVLTNNEELAAKAFSLHHIGRIPGRPFYEHHNLGSNYRMTEFQAAILMVQLSRLDRQTRRRHENGLFLDAEIGKIEGLTPLRRDPFMTRISRHLYGFRYNADAFGVSRDRFMSALRAEGVGCGACYPHPLFKNPLFAEKRFGRIAKFIKYPDYSKLHHPNCERLCRELVCFSHPYLLGTRKDMHDIVRALKKVRGHADELRA